MLYTNHKRAIWKYVLHTKQIPLNSNDNENNTQWEKKLREKKHIIRWMSIRYNLVHVCLFHSSLLFWSRYFVPHILTICTLYLSLFLTHLSFRHVYWAWNLSLSCVNMILCKLKIICNNDFDFKYIWFSMSKSIRNCSKSQILFSMTLNKNVIIMKGSAFVLFNHHRERGRSIYLQLT